MSESSDSWQRPAVTRADLTRVDELTGAQRYELAERYIDLFGCLLDALHDCEDGYAFVRWGGDRFIITGHPPEDLGLTEEIVWTADKYDAWNRVRAVLPEGEVYLFGQDEPGTDAELRAVGLIKKRRLISDWTVVES